AAARIGLADVTKTRIVKGVDHIAGIVARTIVDHDDLEILESLRAHGLDRGPQFGRSVVNGDHDAEEWRTHTTPLPARRSLNCPALVIVSVRHSRPPGRL